MRTSKEAWLLQNRLWLQLAATSIILGVVLIFAALTFIPQIYPFWSKALSSGQPTIAEIESEQLVEETRRKQLVARLDSLKSETDTREFDQKILSEVKKCCLQWQVALTGYDRVPAEQRASKATITYRLLLEGKFHAVTLLIADLESLPFELSILTLALETKATGSDELRGILVIQSEVR